MNTRLLAATISGILLGTTGLAHAQTSYGSLLGDDTQQLDSQDAPKHACKGQNACKGQGGCKTDKHACKAQNACKGQGGCRTDGKGSRTNKSIEGIRQKLAVMIYGSGGRRESGSSKVAPAEGHDERASASLVGGGRGGRGGMGRGGGRCTRDGACHQHGTQGT